MQVEYRGFNAQLGKLTRNQTHIWCYAHVLNFFIGDITSKVVQSINLSGILNSCAFFIKKSYT